MARKTLIVGGILELPDGSLVIGLNTNDDTLRGQWVSMKIAELKTQFEGKKIHVFGEGYAFETSVLGVEISNSIADFKNVFLKIANNEFTQKIRLNDEVEVAEGRGTPKG
jgi:hypothetical protein